MGERLTELTAEDQARVEAAWIAHGRYVEGVAARFAYQRDAIPDIVQEVQLRLCQSLSGVREPQYLRTWLFKVTQNAALSMFRRHARVETREVALDVSAVDAGIDVEADVIARDAQDHRRRVLARGIAEALTPRQREAVRHMLQPSGVSISNRRADHPAISRARKRLRRWMQAQGYEPPTPDKDAR